MRISDWSSDVCSSDLPVLRGDPVPHERGGHRQDHRAAVAAHQRQRPQPTPVDRLAAFGTQPAPHSRPMGREFATAIAIKHATCIPYDAARNPAPRNTAPPHVEVARPPSASTGRDMSYPPPPPPSGRSPTPPDHDTQWT